MRWRFTHWCVFEHYIAMTLELSVDIPSIFSRTFHTFRWFCHFASLDSLRHDVQWRLWWLSKLSDDLSIIVVYGDWAGSSCHWHTYPKRWNNPTIAMPDVQDPYSLYMKRGSGKDRGEGNSPKAAQLKTHCDQFQSSPDRCNRWMSHGLMECKNFSPSERK